MTVVVYDSREENAKISGFAFLLISKAVTFEFSGLDTCMLSSTLSFSPCRLSN